jgi:hypothetical protein
VESGKNLSRTYAVHLVVVKEGEEKGLPVGGKVRSNCYRLDGFIGEVGRDEVLSYPCRFTRCFTGHIRELDRFAIFASVQSEISRDKVEERFLDWPPVPGEAALTDSKCAVESGGTDGSVSCVWVAPSTISRNLFCLDILYLWPQV